MLFWSDPQKHDSWHRLVQSENQFAEIFVFGQQEPIFVIGPPRDFRISCPRLDLGDVERVMSGAT